MSGRIDVVTRTRELGATVASFLTPGDVVSLSGDLGAGKTCLVQGAARALGVTDPVASPTFVLAREYRGDVPVHHLDVYRLERLQEVIDLGFEDLLDPGGVIFIEWGQAIAPLLPPSYLHVDLRADEDETRRIAVVARGPRWAPRWEKLEAALGDWRAA